jgi:hypothetical protein
MSQWMSAGFKPDVSALQIAEADVTTLQKTDYGRPFTDRRAGMG